MDKVIVDYKVAKGFLILEIEAVVMEYIKNGYVPIGGISFDGNTSYLIQAMIKYAEQ